MKITREKQSEHWGSKSTPQIQSYWDSPPASARSEWFADILQNYDFDSVFEIGMFSGRNLKYIEDRFSKVSLGGLDINKKAVQFAKNKLPAASFFQSDLYDIGSLSFSADIVYTSGTLIHIVPKDLRDIISNIIPHAKKYVMHIEQLGNNELVAGPKSMSPTYKESSQCQWNPDLVAIYKELGYESKVIPLPDDCKTNGAKELVIVKAHITT